MKKRYGGDSQSLLLVSIFWLSCLCAARTCAQEPNAPKVFDVGLQLKETQVALSAEKERAVELEQANAALRKELEQLRSRYADLYLVSRQQRQEQQDLDLRVAHLLTDHREIEAGQALARAVRALREADSGQRDLRVAVEEFGTYLASVLEVLQPSDTLKSQIERRYQVVRSTAEATKNPLSILVARRDSGNPAERVCRILSLNEELQVAVLDAGSDAGVRPGATWHVLVDGQRTADLKILETRPNVSAALVIRGTFQQIGPGNVVVPE